VSLASSWNELAASWLTWAMQAAVLSIVMLAVVSALWLVLHRRASAHLGHLLFLVPLLPLALPPLGALELELPASAPAAAWLERLPQPSPSLQPTAPASDLPALAENGAAQGVEAPAPAPSPTATPTETSRAATPRLTPAGWLMLAWWLVSGVLLARFVVVQVQTHRMVRSARDLAGPEGERARAALARLAPRLGLRRAVRVAASESVGSPAVWGLRHPTVVVPPGLVERLDDRQLDWVLLHELAHVARHDLVLAALQRVVQVVWFLHPAVWLATRTAEQLRECACDETALARLTEGPRRPCAEALLEVVAGRLPRATPRLALQTLHDETTLMKKRILRLLDPARTARSGLSPAALPVLVLLAGASLASVRVTQDPAPRVQLEELEIVDDLDEGQVSLEAAREARDRALAWLLTQQHADGHWSTGPATEVDTGEFNSIGVTALTVLALHQQQASDRDDARAAAIARALGYLGGVQEEETGLFGPVSGHRVMASHAVATLAWLRTREGRAEGAWRPQAEHAVAAILRAHNPYSGWRFGQVPDGDSDSFMTSLMLSSLAEAAAAGIDVPRDTIRSGFSFLEEMTEPSNGRTGYNARGSMAPRLAAKGQDFPARYSEMCTAIAIVARLDWGQDPVRSDAIRDGAHLISSSAPDWDPVRGSTDFYYWLYGSEALARLGGYAFEHWREALLHALVPHQDAEGWWPAVDAWSDEGTTVHATVVNTLALQAVLR
jgi:beta-lactamase regulating signal transducer with metallopeptidase domain